MTIASKLTLVGSLIAAAQTASAEPAATTGTEQVEADATLRPPGAVETEARPAPVVFLHHIPKDPTATTERWGGGVRLTGLSGIGVLPGVAFAAEVAVIVRHDEYFGELALSRWKPRETYMITTSPDHVELRLDMWTARGGWASMKMPLRGWVLAEVGEIAGASEMGGVVTRMMMGDTPQNRQWRAVGAGFGVAWPISNQIRLIGNMELAVPIQREPVELDRYGTYQADALTARYSLGLEVGWR